MGVEWKTADTAPRNGNVIITRNGVVWRWMPYKQNSPEFLSGTEGRWQVRRNTGHWANATAEPKEWRGLNLPAKKTDPSNDYLSDRVYEGTRPVSPERLTALRKAHTEAAARPGMADSAIAKLRRE
jgi:hypothetical protein